MPEFKYIEPDDGLWLKEVMAEKKITQSQLAKRVGTNGSQMSGWLKGDAGMQIEKVVEIEKILGAKIILDPHTAKGLRSEDVEKADVPAPKPSAYLPPMKADKSAPGIVEQDSAGGFERFIPGQMPAKSEPVSAEADLRAEETPGDTTIPEVQENTQEAAQGAAGSLSFAPDAPQSGAERVADVPVAVDAAGAPLGLSWQEAIGRQLDETVIHGVTDQVAESRGIRESDFDSLLEYVLESVAVDAAKLSNRGESLIDALASDDWQAPANVSAEVELRIVMSFICAFTGKTVRVHE